MNSIVGPIFIKSFVEKKNVYGFCEQCTRPTEISQKCWNALSKKKKKKRGETHTQLVFTYPNIY